MQVLSRRYCNSLTLGLSIVIIAFLLPTAALADSWSAPHSVVSGYNWYGNLAVNTNGDAIAIWLNNAYPYQIQSARRKAGSSAWSLPLVVATAPGAPSPQIVLDGSGNALAIWNDSPGLLTSSLPSGATKWQAPKLMTSIPAYPTVAMDAAGDVVLAFNCASGICTLTRPAGGIWGASVNAAPTSGLGLTSPILTMSDDGSVVLAYQAYYAWTKRRHPTSLQLNTTRRNGLNGKWMAPVAVGSIAPNHQFGVAVDAAGNAIMVADQLSIPGAGLESVVQKTGTTIWTTPFTLSSNVNSLAGVVSDQYGNVTVVYQIVAGTNGVMQGNSGSLLSNTWGTPTQISSGTVDAWGPRLAGNRFGEAIASWFVYDPVNYTNLKLQTVALRNPGAAWKTPIDLFVKGVNYGTTAPIIGIDGQGRAVAVWDVTVTIGFPHTITTADYAP